MNKYDSSAIRNVAFIGHGGAGKTTLCETLLQHVGLITRVPAGIMDYATDEKERGYSIDLGIARFSWNNLELNILDIPGYQEFFQNAVSALSAVESASVVIAASDGVTVNTRKSWELSEQKKLPKIIVLTKLDGENINLDDIVADIQRRLGKHCIPLVVPDQVGSSMSQVYDVLDTKTPENVLDSSYRDKLVETIVETDDELLNRYLEGQEIPDDIIRKQLRIAIQKNRVVPIISVSPLKNIGVQKFLEVVAEFLPSPLECPAKTGKAVGQDQEKSYEPLPDAPFSAQVFKIYNDPFGRLVYFRVYSGTLSSSSSIYDVNTESSERVANVCHILGKEQKPIEKAIPGDIVVIAKVENIQLGDTLVSNEKDAIIYPKMVYPTPMVSLAVSPKSRGDEQKIGASLNKLTEEDPTFSVKRAEETNEIVISGMSNLHLEIMINRLKNRFKVECTHSLPKIPYRETITGKAESTFCHKKQTGGHGQYAKVSIKMEPTERGAGFEFVDKIVGGVVPSQFVVSTEKGVNGIMKKGILASCPVVDVRVILYDGKTHDVDSSDAAFQIAGSKAFQEAFESAKPVLLEPIEIIEVTVPSKYVGDISGNLTSRRGRIVGSDVNGDYQTIKANIPLAEVQTYSTDLKSMTGGEGTYLLQFSHYDTVPSHIQEKIIARSKEVKKV